MNTENNINNILSQKVIHGKIIKMIFPFIIFSFPVSVALSQNINKPISNQKINNQQMEAYFSEAELDQMLAPIALYPDAILAQMFMVATYPNEVQEASNWLKSNPRLIGNQAVAAANKFKWDNSVKSLTAIPQILHIMAAKIEWATYVGNAFLWQSDKVMESVQYLRQRALEAGTLYPNDKMNVIISQDYIIIESVNPETVYLPSYNPNLAYGTWWWKDNRPDCLTSASCILISNNVVWNPVDQYPYVQFDTILDWQQQTIYLTSYEPTAGFYIQWSSGHSYYTRPWYHDPFHRHNVSYYRYITVNNSPAHTRPVASAPAPKNPFVKPVPPRRSPPSHATSLRPPVQKPSLPHGNTPSRPALPKANNSPRFPLAPPKASETPRQSGSQPHEQVRGRPAPQRMPEFQNEQVQGKPAPQRLSEHQRTQPQERPTPSPPPPSAPLPAPVAPPAGP